MKFQILRNPHYLGEFFCPTMIFYDKIDFLKRVRGAYPLENYGWKFNFVSENQLLYFWAPEKLWDDPDCLIDIQNTPTQCAWVGHMQIIYFGLQFDLYSTPVAP